MTRAFRGFALLLMVFGLLATTPAAAQFSLPGLGFGSGSSESESSDSDSQRDLGTAAVALVEEVHDAPEAGVGIMDYVFPKQTIALGESGVIVLAHLDGCLVETITGGTVTVQPKGSAVEDGRRTAKKVNCRVPKAVITAENREAGAVVNRVALFEKMDWTEQVVRNARPVFKWKSAKGESRVRVIEMDREEPQAIWETRTEKSYVAYPDDAPALKIGMPYRIEIEGPDEETAKALFSIDPNLEVADNFLNRIVTVSR